MAPDAADPFVLLKTAADAPAAHLCAALLRSEGIESRLQGESLGPYRLTVGEMAETQVWVPRSRLEEANRLLAEAEAEVEPPAEVEPGSDPERTKSTVWRRLGPLFVVATLLALAAWHLLGRPL